LTFLRRLIEVGWVGSWRGDADAFRFQPPPVEPRLIARVNPAVGLRKRAAPRVIKRKIPKWHVKRAHHGDWPQSQQQPSSTAVPL